VLTAAEKLRLLGVVPGLPQLPGPCVAALASGVDECDVAPGEVLAREGSPSRQSFLVVEGQAAVVIGGHNVAVIGPGAFVGDVCGPDDHAAVATVTAHTAMRVLVLTPQVLRALARWKQSGP